jgi:hypothetical protein
MMSHLCPDSRGVGYSVGAALMRRGYSTRGGVRYQRADALRSLLILHSFRFLGLAFLVPGVVSSDLPRAFATSAAYRDIVAGTLALLLLLFLRSGTGILVAWIFSVWGSVDLLNAFYQANATGLCSSGILCNK